MTEDYDSDDRENCGFRLKSLQIVKTKKAIRGFRQYLKDKSDITNSLRSTSKR